MMGTLMSGRCFLMGGVMGGDEAGCGEWGCGGGVWSFRRMMLMENWGGFDL